uniref:Uncharacterized protein n=1 Tax=Schistocephalus solidus TaxID=70667 RepID=A0A0X3P1Z1_SCHSO
MMVYVQGWKASPHCTILVVDRNETALPESCRQNSKACTKEKQLCRGQLIRHRSSPLRHYHSKFLVSSNNALGFETHFLFKDLKYKNKIMIGILSKKPLKKFIKSVNVHKASKEHVNMDNTF